MITVEKAKLHLFKMALSILAEIRFAYNFFTSPILRISRGRKIPSSLTLKEMKDQLWNDLIGNKVFKIWTLESHFV